MLFTARDEQKISTCMQNAVLFVKSIVSYIHQLTSLNKIGEKNRNLADTALIFLILCESQIGEFLHCRIVRLNAI